MKLRSSSINFPIVIGLTFQLLDHNLDFYRSSLMFGDPHFILANKNLWMHFKSQLQVILSK